MSTRKISIILWAGFGLIVVLAAALFLIPSPVAAPTAFTSPNVNVFTPFPGATVPKTFSVTGEARGPWYFEALFLVQVRDKNDNVVASGPARAQSDWMTDKFVPFRVTLTIGKTTVEEALTNVKYNDYAGPATIVLLKNNPSGLPENDDSVSMPIIIGR